MQEKKNFSFRNFFGFGQEQVNELGKKEDHAGGCGSGGCSDGGCESHQHEEPSLAQREGHTVLDKTVNRREAFRFLGKGAAIGAAALSVSNTLNAEKNEATSLKMDEYFKGNYREMTQQERQDTIKRLERLAKIQHGRDISIKDTPAPENTQFGYAFNLSKCKGYGHCIDACVEENNQDRKTNMQYIRIFEMENGKMNLEEGTADYSHMVPAEGHFYLGTQCMQCSNAPCTQVCPVGATWTEKDGITVVDYDWCVGCRYCEAACPYWARRFNWNEPEIPAEEINPNQHYLGNRLRKKGVMEKCTFCISRTREGSQPACAEACPTGARVFGNILDPDSEIRYILENKKVFRLKEELGTEPKFWYYMD